MVPLKKPKPMVARVATGLVGAAGTVLVLFTGNGLPFALTVAIFSILGISEFYRGVRKQGAEPRDLLGYIACIIFQYAAWTHGGSTFGPYVAASLLLLLVACLLAELRNYRPKPILNVGTTLLGGVYVGWLFSFLTLLHGENSAIIRPPTLVPHSTSGQWLVLFVIAATWLSDTGALFVGLGLGRHKLAPQISPKKTWEGSIGGLLLSLAGGTVLGWWLHIPMADALLLALLCGIAGQTGDLCESALKRDLGVKDFGDVLPGHGGVLDRIDSLLLAAPLAYYYVVLILAKHH